MGFEKDRLSAIALVKVNAVAVLEVAHGKTLMMLSILKCPHYEDPR